ncbi:MAG: rhomboid family intramembrane serine protease [Muribaculaceae bacterium]|nr:rhomboid family intramembrane serine protease [Muribaculaceae bacterium]
MYNGQPSIFRNIPPVVLNLLILNTLIFGVMALSSQANAIFTRHLALYYFTSPDFRPFQLISYMFLHGSFGHLFFNMFALFIFGRTIERTMGSARFLFYYMTCGICAALVQLGVFAVLINHTESLIGNPELCRHIIENHGYVDFSQFDQRLVTSLLPELRELYGLVNTPLVGASGAIYGVLLAFGFLYPNVPVYIFFIPIPVKAKWLIIGYFVLELVYGVGGTADGVAHFAHLGGMIFGFLLLIYWKRKGVFNNHWFF